MPEDTVVVIGDALIDVLRVDGVERSFVGGAALNVAIGLSLLGSRVTLIAMVGDDEHAATIRAFLAEHNVDLIATASPLGSSVATSDRSNGEPRYHFNEAAQHRRIRFGTAERAAIADARMVIVSCFPFDDDTQFAELVDALQSSGDRLLIDPNPREGMLHDRGRFIHNFEHLARTALLVKVGDDDAALLYDGSLTDLRDRLHRLGTRIILATAGSAGATVLMQNGVAVSAGIPTSDRPIVDTMGAGDACLSSAAATIITDGVPATSSEAAMLTQRAMGIAAETCRFEGALLRKPDTAYSIRSTP